MTIQARKGKTSFKMDAPNKMVKTEDHPRYDRRGGETRSLIDNNIPLYFN